MQTDPNEPQKNRKLTDCILIPSYQKESDEDRALRFMPAEIRTKFHMLTIELRTLERNYQATDPVYRMQRESLLRRINSKKDEIEAMIEVYS